MAFYSISQFGTTNTDAASGDPDEHHDRQPAIRENTAVDADGQIDEPLHGSIAVTTRGGTKGIHIGQFDS